MDPLDGPIRTMHANPLTFHLPSEDRSNYPLFDLFDHAVTQLGHCTRTRERRDIDKRTHNYIQNWDFWLGDSLISYHSWQCHKSQVHFQSERQTKCAICFGSVCFRTTCC